MNDSKGVIMDDIDHIISFIPVMAGRVMPNMVLAYGNDLLAQHIGKLSSDVSGRPLVDVIRPQGFALLEAAIQQGMFGEVVDYEAMLHFPDLGRTKVRVRVVPHHDQENQVVGVLFFILDNTQALLAELHQADLKQIFHALDHHAIVSATDVHGTIILVNDKFCEISGYERDELIGQNHRMVNAGRHSPAFFEQMWATISVGEVWQGEICNRAKDGSLYWVRSTIVPFVDETGLPAKFISIRTDVTSIKNAEEENHRLAFYDPLTNLPNRRMLIQRLTELSAQTVGQGTHAGVMLIDLDDFKKVNDVYGHSVGDTLIFEVANRLRALGREGDTVAYMGGDEFMLLFHNLGHNDDEATRRMRLIETKVVAELSRPHHITFDHGNASMEIHCSACIGGCIVSQMTLSPQEILRRTDMALSHAKTSGRRRTAYFQNSMDESMTHRFRLEQDLTEAIKREQFVLHFQPIVDHEGCTLGLEALIRWLHPKQGLISPATFIPIAESSDRIVSIGWWVMEQACFQLGRWQDQPERHHLWIAVNVSAKQLCEGSFVLDLESLLKRSGAPASQLCLEITETVLLEGQGFGLIQTFAAIRSLGIRLSLDDFGTGYSSLSYLKSLPLTKVKIDQMFVRSLLDSPKDQAITEAILDLADKLGLSVVAEGVETQGQFELLSNLGCQQFQGYLFGRPAPLDKLIIR